MTTAGTPASLVEAARALIDDAERVAVLTGAGISTDSGIPDFRGPQGLWTKDPKAERASNIRYYVQDPEVRRANWAARAAGALWANVEPNIGHHALVHLEQRGKLHTLITQNVDELHQRAGNSADLVVEVHGTTRKVACLSCEYRDNMEEAIERVRAGEEDPDCRRSEIAAHEADVFLTVGTSLGVYPINETVRIAKHAGARVVILNGEPTEMDHLGDIVLHDRIAAALPLIVGMTPS
jgi:NAD-dependent deacetylase